MEAELRAKALEEMRQKTEAEKSKALQESSTEKKKEKK